MTQSAKKSMTLGKAYEYACLSVANEIIGRVRPTEIVFNSSFDVAKRCFESISESERADMLKSAAAGIGLIIQMEPKIVEDGNDILTISLQPDNVAITGDIRDVLLIRKSIDWEIGISVKHNHAALKHSRLSSHIDFGTSWFNTPCSKSYFDTVDPIFSVLGDLRGRGVTWKEMPNKTGDVYVPLLNAFMAEFKSLVEKHGKQITRGIISYLLGSDGKDYYKLIHNNNHKVKVMPFNVNGTLNQMTTTKKPETKIPNLTLPTRIIELDFKKKSKTTVILTMDNGWAMSLRIHSASTIVEPSLKFDIKLIGQPADLLYIETDW